MLKALKDLEGKGEDNQMDENITGGKNWMDNLKGPTLDYNGVFDEDTGIDRCVPQSGRVHPALICPAVAGRADTLADTVFSGVDL